MIFVILSMGNNRATLKKKRLYVKMCKRKIGLIRKEGRW